MLHMHTHTHTPYHYGGKNSAFVAMSRELDRAAHLQQSRAGRERRRAQRTGLVPGVAWDWRRETFEGE